MPADQGAATADRRRLAARDQARRLPRGRAQGRRPRSALQPPPQGPRFTLIVELLSRLRSRSCILDGGGRLRCLVLPANSIGEDEVYRTYRAPSEADLAGLKSNVRHTDACAGRYSSGILKSAFKKHRSGGKRHRLRSAIAAMRYEGPTRTLIAPDLFGAHIIHDRAARAWLGEDGGWTEFPARLNSNSQPAAELRVLPLETGDSLNTAFFKDNWVSL